ncbi:chloride channel protein [Marinilabilia salmonicolor]|jgi:CIC family chloride channel protein|uniref:CIC family chloride channel protein n=1 Tax=Marinilabilia salmonicolor TaxID=989 RepID=A0A2T0XIK0_9BACT|nr:chloride channel protein [Marinilabilia salmonicolor]PRY98742.1 CIC family chloride channel protein [Marinilabilia salmonicolor]RCW38997.1 CIC family chloride channel protein [Marinilabilia salmonicolor]
MGQKKNLHPEKLLGKFLKWRLRHISNRQFIMFLSILIGIASGLGAVAIKNSVHFISVLVQDIIHAEGPGYIFLFSPIIGILLTVLFIKYVLKRPVRHGIPNVLYALSKRKGRIRSHNMFSSIVTSSLTVGFGGSVGLEGPTVSTGAAIGSNIGQLFHLNFRQITLLLGCASAAAMSAIFKAPVAAIVFALEVIMLDLTLSAIVPLLMASASAVLTSYLFMGQQLLYPVNIRTTFEINDLLFYILLGIITGLVAVYFTKVYLYIERLFGKLKTLQSRLLAGGLGLGILLFFFPSLYGEGYEIINRILAGDVSFLFDQQIFSGLRTYWPAVAGLMLLMIGLKVVATSITFGSGGVGGIFAPTLFIGSSTGLLFAMLISHMGIAELSEQNFALAGMGGLIAGVLHAPLTGLFLIADVTGGYELFLPLMITAAISFATAKTFVKNSVYTHQLAQRKELLTHDKDQVALTLMDVTKLIETDFSIISPDAKLGDLVNVVSKAHRNLFPVVDNQGILHGMVKMDDIRNIIFKPDLYETVKVNDLMYMPEYFISPDDSMEDLVEIFRTSGRFNIAVIDKGKYLGFISRANAFTAYRNFVKRFSGEY